VWVNSLAIQAATHGAPILGIYNLRTTELAAKEFGPMMNLTAPLAGRPSNGWDIPPPNFGAPGADYLVRGINAVLGLTGNTTTDTSER
jgi:hypothetical protein